MNKFGARAPFEYDERLTPMQRLELDTELNKRIKNNTLFWGVDETKRHLQRQILEHGSIAAAHAALAKRREAQEKAAKTRAIRKEEREQRRLLELSVPGYVYVYRFKYKSEWLYKFRLEPAKTKRLELFRYLWVETGVKAFLEGWLRWIRSGRYGASYSLSNKQLMYLVDLPLGTPKEYIELPVALYSQPKQEIQEESKSFDPSGYVYVVKEINGNHYKIGRTRNPKNRMTTFTVKLPYRVEYEVLIKCDDMYSLEDRLHRKFGHRRVDGEWFTLTPEDVEYIRSLAKDMQP